MTQHPAAPRPTQTDDPRPAVVTLVGNPRPGSRTLTAARTVAARVADHLGLAPADPTPATIDLAEIATEILAPEHPRADTARDIAASAAVLVVATPVYKGSYTGLLKAFLDLYGPDGLAGVVAVPVVVSGNPAHALAGEVHLRPLLVELGATVPARTLTLLDSRLGEADLTSTVDAWLDHAGGPLLRAASAAVGQETTHRTAPELAEVTR
ncbi:MULTISPECIES: NADPH-dependent FMN reductase [Oerskovia]|uniref:NAD(P)H-dependent oxidoreductase n=1 Tax=Oerskovia rustica TaxID=2762237 RepID=A0ABR8RRD1_9CELL|nr:NAD(P)H-dependent oxidoreductase [Oerskovia rustica]MBD7950017.1 NAD(P)H-dependent oxidoreductase [Oerskovia rustica]